MNVDLLNSLVDETKETIKTLEAQVQAAQEELENQVASTEKEDSLGHKPQATV